MNNQYEIEAEIKRRFNDVLNELIGKYEFLRMHKIKSVIEGNRYLFLNNQRCLRTIEDLKLTNDSGFIFINLEIDETNNSINLQASKLILKPLPKLHFCMINLENQKIDIDIPEDSIFLKALNKLKIKLNLDGLIFESVFYYNRGEKIKMTNETIKKSIKELNIPKNEIIYIKSKDKNNIPINIKFIWANNNYNKYEFKAGKKDKFHSVGINFLEAFEEFSNLMVTKYYLIISENKPYDTKISQENTHILTTLNNISPEDIYEIENEQDYCFLTLEALGIDEKTEIYFETREYQLSGYELLQKKQEEAYMRQSMLTFSQLKDQGVIYIKFKTSIGTEPSILKSNINENIKQVLARLKKKNAILQKVKINAVMLNGENLLNEENKDVELKNLGIKDKDEILLIIDEKK